MVTASLDFFDTHAHLDVPPLLAELATEIPWATRVGVRRFLVPGIAPAGWPLLMATVARVPGALAAPGVHPLAAADWGPEVEAQLGALLPKAAALGEVGLDGMLAAPPLPVQERAFRAQVRLAVTWNKPLLIHCRRAFGQTLQILREEGAERVGGIVHAFSGSVESAHAAVAMNFAIGIGGPVTYDNARRILEVVRRLPDAWLVLETDAPDLTPEPHRGELNRPAYLPLIAERVAEIKGWSLAATARLTTANAMRVLRLPNTYI